MSAPAGLAAALAAALGEPVASARPVAGGSINDAWRVELASGRELFVKSRADAAVADFRAEAAGLRWLREAGAVPLPDVVAVGEDQPWLALELVPPGPLSPAGAEELGRGLAALHATGAEAHGVLPPASPDGILRLGSVEVELQQGERWADVYAGAIVLPLVRRTRDRGSLAAADAAAVEAVCERIGDLAGPSEPPARLHGDLWSGNVHAGADGRGWLIDPAAHGGHREMDLAMLRLFGSPSERIFAAYAEAWPPADGHAERVPLWQLQPLLVHALLFGGSYGAAAGEAARRLS